MKQTQICKFVPKRISSFLTVLLLVFAISVQGIALNIQNTNTPEDSIYAVVEKMPQFSGGEGELLTFIHKSLHYTPIEEEHGIPGRVVVRFMVTKTGAIDNVEILRSLDPACDKEAVRVVKLLPNFIPGEQNGKKVAVWYTLQVSFKPYYYEK